MPGGRLAVMADLECPRADMLRVGPTGAAPRPFGTSRGRSWPRESLLRGTNFPVPDSREGGAQALVKARESGQMASRGSPDPLEFPVFSRRSGNWGAETGSRWTARSANQSARPENLRAEREPSGKSPPFRGPLGEGLRVSQAETVWYRASPRGRRPLSPRPMEAVR
jgi:hypothetical protein